MTEEEKKRQDELWKQDRIRARREEWKKIKNLGPGARVQYLWDYYKIVMVIALGACIAIWLVFNVVQGIRTHNLLYVCVLNSNELDPDTELLREDYIKARGGMKRMQDMVFDSSIYVDPRSNGTSQQDVATSMKIAAFVGAGSVDVFLAPPDVTDFEQESGMYMALDGLLSQDEIRALGEAGCLYYDSEPETEGLPEMDETEWMPASMTEGAYGDAGTFSLNTEAESGSHIYAVRVDQAGVLGQYHIYGGTQVWFSIIGNAPHPEEAVRFLHFLLGEDMEGGENDE